MTPLTKQSLEELKQKARAATPGPWVRLGSSTDSYNFYLWHQDDFRSCGVPDTKICEVFGHEPEKTKRVNVGQPGECTIPDDRREHNLQYISAASPDVILDLITRVEGMNLALQRITWQMNQSKTFKEYAEEHQDAAKSALESFGVK